VTPLLFWDVDTQFDFMRESGALYVSDAESIIENLAHLTDAARSCRIPVVASACDHEAGDDEISDEPDFAETYPPHCLRGTPGAQKITETTLDWTVEFRHELAEPSTWGSITRAEHPSALIHKKHFDVFSNPNTLPLLEAFQPEHIVVYGVALDVCNRAAIEGMLSRGYKRITAITDATRPIRIDVGEELLSDWSDRGVALQTTGGFLEWLGRSETADLRR